MDFTLSDEQQMIRDSLTSWLSDRHDDRAWLRLTAAWPPGSDDTWTGLAELGVLGLLIPEEHGGISMGALDLHVVAEVMGHHLVVDPFLSTAVLGARLIADLGSEAQRVALLPAIAGGELKLAVAHAERSARFDPFGGSTTAVADGDALRLKGEKIVVLDGPSADRFLVVVQEEGQPVLAMVEDGAEGLSVNAYRMVDERGGADITFDGTPATRIGTPGDQTRAAVEAAFDLATGFLCSEAAGAMQRIIGLTVDHLSSRRQFGTELSNFQALRHRIAEMQSETAAAQATALGAAAAQAGPAAERVRMTSAAKAQGILSARFVSQNGVQLQGGMGMSEEVAVGRYFKRLTMFEPMFGDLSWHRARFAAASAAAA